MKIIAISGEIGWDVWPDQIREQIEAAAGDDIEFQISSPGGYIYDGLEIFNMIKRYAGNTVVRIVGMAASMASYIALAGDRVIAESNAIYMIHNARAYSGGDQNAHRKLADILEGLSNLLGQEYIKQTGKDKKAIAKLMDVESYYYGNEILEAGFVDEMVEPDEMDAAARDDLVLDAMVQVEAMDKKLREKPEGIETNDKIAAILKPEADAGGADVRNSNQRNGADQPNNSNEEKIMNWDEFFKNPENKAKLDALIQEAENKGAEVVQAKIEAVTPFLESADYVEVHEECIQVITGKEEVGTVKAMVKAIDKVKALHDSKEAVKETDKAGETPADKSEKSTDGIVRNQEDEDEAVAKLTGGK